jgi:hypothetical protein
MPVPSQRHYGFHSFRLLIDFVCLYTPVDITDDVYTASILDLRILVKL